MHYVTQEIVAEMMGVAAEAVGPVAWLTIQEEASGVTRKQIAKNLGVEETDLIALRDSVTGVENESSEEIWQRGVLTVKTAMLVNTTQVATGWDAVEAIAVDKLAKSLNDMKTSGDPMKMLAIATQANKALRRRNGEGPGQSGRNSTNIQVNNMNGNAELELQSGNLGTLRLNLSPKVQAQLTNPDRVIDGVVRKQTPAATGDLKMLGLRDTRSLVVPAEKEIERVKTRDPNVNPAFNFEAFLAAAE